MYNNILKLIFLKVTLFSFRTNQSEKKIKTPPAFEP
jgi:hypothetical protein